MKELTPKLQLLLDFLMLTVGAAIAAFAIEEFLVPCTILDGGVIGIGIMVNNLTHIPLSILTIVLNIPFLLDWFPKTWCHIYCKIRLRHGNVFHISGSICSMGQCDRSVSAGGLLRRSDPRCRSSVW